MEFEKEDFDGLMFNVNELEASRSVLRTFPGLNIFKEFDKKKCKLDFNKVLKYIIYVYDKNSPLRREYVNILKRKAKALKLAGFIKDDNDVWGKDIENMILCQDKHINSMIIRFLRLHRNAKYAYLIALEENYYKMLEKMIEGKMAPSDYQVFSKMKDEIEDEAIEILNQDDLKALKEDLYRYVDYEKLNIMPEDYAEQIASGKFLL
ncbi:hypothetical protein KKE60_08270 [Patescibacteria group bacterium]|uniref:Uncharacterized protein n=1 Tax=viral metagenome TaxID=1070528 RepID=A0A6M3M9V3_9ZZZZ|nr:hypothetical protein [Patescibacteria group bacterium]